jgi:non-canonical (house-cleaning) NTP pyrophosphatase
VEETTEIVPIEAAVVGHPEGAVDLKVDKIATEDVAASRGRSEGVNLDAWVVA